MSVPAQSEPLEPNVPAPAKRHGETESASAKRPRTSDELDAADSAEAVRGNEREVAAGIIAYIADQMPGFSAIIKHRTHDFMVFEIDRDGQAVRLTDMTVPKITDVSTASKSQPIQDDLSDSDKDHYQTLVPHFGPEVTEDIRRLVESKGQEPTQVLSATILDKEKRAAMHRLLRECLGQDVTSDTMDGAIRVRSLHTVKASDIRGSIRKAGSSTAMATRWEDMPGQYCQFSLYKEGKDTMDAIEHICRVTKVSNKFFAYAGTKDRQAVTVQCVTARRVTAEKLALVNASSTSVRVGNFRYVKEQLKLGDLSGNRFVIVLRDVKDCSDAELDLSLVSLRDRGFINYFGTQRFGTGMVPTHHIGARLLRADWAGAIELLLQPSTATTHENSAQFLARRHWADHQDPSTALRMFPRNCVAERSVLSFFTRKQDNLNDKYGAIIALPLNMRKLYVHSYQSYIWNRAATERIRRFGLAPVIGDLVAVGDINDTDESGRRIKVDHVNEANITQYSAKDVVLPLPGHRILYPSNEIGEFMKNLMQEDGLDPSAMERKVSFTSLPGDYRHVFALPDDLEWRWLRYSDPNEQLALSDVERLQGSSESPHDHGTYRALRLAFTLRPGQYATMALRELMHRDTSPAIHIELSKQHVKQHLTPEHTAESDPASDQ